MLEIKFRYRIKFPSPQGKIHTYHFSLEDIEKGILRKDFLTDGVKIISRDQYTGRKDKNGKEIYDKSIIKSDYNKDCVYLIKQISSIEWRIYVKYKKTKLKLYDENIDFFVSTEHMEVIGCIHENPELLE